LKHLKLILNIPLGIDDRLVLWKELSLTFYDAEMRAYEIEQCKDEAYQLQQLKKQKMSTRGDMASVAAASANDTAVSPTGQLQSPIPSVAGRFGYGRIRNIKSPVLPLLNQSAEYFSNVERLDEAIRVLTEQRDVLNGAGAIEEDECITISRPGPKPRTAIELSEELCVSQKRNIYLDNKVSALQKTVESITNSAITSTDLNIGEAVLKAYKDAGVMRGVIHGQKNSLTNVSGFIANLLNTVGLVLFNQMPFVILLVITLIFGLLPNYVLLTLLYICYLLMSYLNYNETSRER